MRHQLILISLCAGVAAGPALAQDACPWAGGDYAFSDHGIYGDFVVDATCTQMEWSRLSDGPESSTLERTKDGWAGALEKADFVLTEDGRHVLIKDPGGPQRRSVVRRKN